MCKNLSVTQIARVAHEANRAYCQIIGDVSQLPWDGAPTSQQYSLVMGVRFRMDNPGSGPEKQHEAWMRTKVEDGWTYGTTKDHMKKTHPCIVPYIELSPIQKVKDVLFIAIVDTLIATALETAK